ncbi:MAG: ribosome maturation factor RimP [Candidatus Omnitrophica bacterium]|nr:ribosome maturation factor RimP [Candidatus Omnitrophota bacterium]MDD5237235.1 ribosome maturation factor RimP [Candidatus Omnitrophota bacterium]MDD5610901.1 ribosome maturation factor RimP [Candidatus Omnitrophota bacterium]
MQLQGKDLIEKIREIIVPGIVSHGLELVDINYYYMANRLVLRVFLDRPEGGINIDECALMNEELGQILDASAVLEQSYTLEVSSPGLDRPLKTRDDFKRKINRELAVFLSEAIKGKIEIHGVLKRLDEGFIYIDSKGEEFQVPYNKIAKARQIIV